MAKNDLVKIFRLESLKNDWSLKPDPWSIQGKTWAQNFSHSVLGKLFEHKKFLDSHPIVLGSLAREELSPLSDLDFVLLGSEESIKEFMSWSQELGLKIRSRVPADIKDLSSGVEIWDYLSLIDGIALTEYAAEILNREKQKILNSSLKIKRTWLKEVIKDRKKRNQIWDNFETLLEPHLKLGRGGLRDLYQSRIILKLFPDIEKKIEPYVLKLFRRYHNFFISIRVELHLNSEQDRLTSLRQPELAEKFGFADYQEFMSFVQRGFSRISFYNDWLVERCLITKKNKKPYNPKQLTEMILKDCGLQSQYAVRRNLNLWLNIKKTKLQRLIEFKKILLNKNLTEKQIEAFFRSRLADRLISELRPLVGYVQHDQYHRWTADAHILSVIKEVIRFELKPNQIPDWKKYAKDLDRQDWQILRWSAFYHDLGKGRDGDHSILGERWVKRDLNLLKEKKEIVNEVSWIVRNHLLFSRIAFRSDIHDPQSLKILEKEKLTKKRIIRLLLFTVFDIRGTNPESWTTWKSKLLLSLGDKLLQTIHQKKNLSKQVESFKKNLEEEQWSSFLGLISDVGEEKVKKDIRILKSQKLHFALYQRSKESWIRFYHPKDQNGLLAEVLGVLFQAGITVNKALVFTTKTDAVYDWFCIEKVSSTVLKRIEIIYNQKKFLTKAPQVDWKKIEFEKIREKEYLLRFLGKDQRGVLWRAAEMCAELKLSIQFVQAQTWGRQVEDVFVVKCESEELLQNAIFKIQKNQT